MDLRVQFLRPESSQRGSGTWIRQASVKPPMIGAGFSHWPIKGVAGILSSSKMFLEANRTVPTPALVQTWIELHCRAHGKPNRRPAYQCRCMSNVSSSRHGIPQPRPRQTGLHALPSSASIPNRVANRSALNPCRRDTSPSPQQPSRPHSGQRRRGVWWTECPERSARELTTVVGGRIVDRGAPATHYRGGEG